MPGLRDAHVRHTTHYLKLAEEAEPELRAAGQIAWLERLELDYENMRVALRWALESGEVIVGLRLAGALMIFWDERGYWREGRQWLSSLLGQPAAVARTAERAKATNAAGALAHSQGDWRAAHAHYTEALAIRRERRDWRGVSASLNNLGLIATDQGDYAAARGFYEESLTIKRELGDRWGTASTLHNLGILAYYLRGFAAARSRLEEALTVRRELDDQAGIAGTVNNLGLVAIGEGDLVHARAWLEEAVAIERRLGRTVGIAECLANLGLLSFLHGDFAAAHHRQAQALTIRRELDDRWGMAESIDRIASLAAAQGRSRKALVLASAATRLRDYHGMTLPPVDEVRRETDVALARATLHESEADAAWVEGQAMTLEQAIAYAVEEVRGAT